MRQNLYKIKKLKCSRGIATQKGKLVIPWRCFWHNRRLGNGFWSLGTYQLHPVFAELRQDVELVSDSCEKAWEKIVSDTCGKFLKVSDIPHPLLSRRLMPGTIVLMAILFVTLLAQCASPGSIQGGPKDETPPSVDSAKSTPTPQINFTPQEITITFDEWVKLDDPFSQIFISPPLEKRPQYRLKGKSLIITFDDEERLQENTTYILNLGTSVQDITESNPVEDYQFVFSTGDQLDSLGFGGMITDALTGEPLENVSVMLYDNLADSAIATLPPAYFARTNKEGAYRLNYLRPGTFQLLGYVDDDLDFRHNAELEPLGFIPDPISTTFINDSTINFTLSLGPPPVYLDDVDTAVAGLMVLNFSGPVTDTGSLKVMAPGIRHMDRLNTQLRIYYSLDSLPVHVITKNIKDLRDTVIVITGGKDTFVPEDLDIERLNPAFLSGETVNLMTNWPVKSLDPALMQLMKQSDQQEIGLDTAYHGFNTIHIKYPWTADSLYRLRLLPGAIVFENGVPHDTLEYRLQPVASEDLASLVITLQADKSYRLPPQFILQLKQKDKVIDQKIVTETGKKITFPALKPGAYTLHVIWDENQNGIWDPARYAGRLPAEEIQKVEIENLRVNWIQETEVMLTHNER